MEAIVTKNTPGDEHDNRAGPSLARQAIFDNAPREVKSAVSLNLDSCYLSSI